MTRRRRRRRSRVFGVVNPLLLGSPSSWRSGRIRGGRAGVGFRALTLGSETGGGPWHAGGESAIWEGGCSGLEVLTWALLRLSSSPFAFRTPPSSSPALVMGVQTRRPRLRGVSLLPGCVVGLGSTLGGRRRCCRCRGLGLLALVEPGDVAVKWAGFCRNGWVVVRWLSSNGWVVVLKRVGVGKVGGHWKPRGRWQTPGRWVVVHRWWGSDSPLGRACRRQWGWTGGRRPALVVIWACGGSSTPVTWQWAGVRRWALVGGVVGARRRW